MKTYEEITMEILKYNPCEEAVAFRKQYKTFKESWESCPRGDWMLWIASKLKINIHQLTYAKALCAETVLHLMKDDRSINAIKVAKKYGKYKVSKKELDAAYAAADAADAAYADTAYAAADTAYAAADTAYAAAADAAAAAYAAADAAAAAAYADAADAAAYAADAAAYAASREDNQKQTADICRKHLTKAVFKKLKINLWKY